MKDKLPKPGKIGAGSGDIDPSWITIPGGNITNNSTDTI